MKPLIKYLLLVLSLSLFSSATYAGSEAGKDSARYYKSHPETFDGKSVDVDCVFVSRINGGPTVAGITFFVAHTKDDDNQLRGGSIVVAVLSDEADAFIRKYGNTPEINRGSSDRVDSKRLKGIFHQLEQGHIYMDTSGEAHAIILENLDGAKGNIRSGDGASEGRGKGKGKF